MLLSDLKVNPKNPQKFDNLEALKLKLTKYPHFLKYRNIIYDPETMHILGGNKRLIALRELGYKEIPDEWVRAFDDEKDEMNDFILIDNIQEGEWDYEVLEEDYEGFEDWGVPPNPFVSEEEAEEDNYEIPDEIKTDIEVGDLIEIGEHRLLCGDSTRTDRWELVMDGKLADLVVTDPPYNVALGMETKEQAKARNRRVDGLVVKNDKMSDEEFYQFLLDFYTSLGSFTKEGGAWYVWHSDSEVINFRKAMSDSGIMPKQGLIWKKSSIVMGRQDYQWNHEPCLYGWKKGAAHGWYSDRKQSTILEFDKPSNNKQHPTMKPIPLIAYQINNSSKSGDLVADGFLGSGSTMVAAHQLKRKCYGMELDPKYCQVIIDRMLTLDETLVVKRNGNKIN